MRGIRLDDGDRVVGACVVEEGKDFLTVTKNGYGKRTDLEEYHVQNRGGKGLKNYNLTQKTGLVADVQVVSDEDDVLLIENGGVIIRMDAADINRYGRGTQGVILMRIEEGNEVISVQRTDKEEEEEKTAEE